MSLYDNYQSLLDYIKSGKNHLDRPAPESNPKSTRIVAADTNYDWIGIKLHQTVVVKFYKDGRVQLNSGGWQTVTTRERINCYAPNFKWDDELKTHVGIGIRVYNQKRIMYCRVSTKSCNMWDDDNPNSKRYYFEDGMTIKPDGIVLNSDGSPMEPVTANKEKAKRKELNQINAYVKSFIEKFINQKIGNPGPGDCWYCLSHIPNSGIPPINTITPEGIKPGFDESNHIKSHIKEKYYVPALLFNAIKEMTYNPENKAMVYGLAPIDQHNIAWATKAPGWESNKPWAIDITQRRLTMLLGRYIRKQLGYQLT